MHRFGSLGTAYHHNHLGLAFIVALLLTGLVIGALARLAIPGRNPMGLVATTGCGLVGAVVGGFIAVALHAGVLIGLIIEIVVAAAIVAALTNRGSRRSFGRRSSRSLWRGSHR